VKHVAIKNADTGRARVASFHRQPDEARQHFGGMIRHVAGEVLLQRQLFAEVTGRRRRANQRFVGRENLRNCGGQISSPLRHYNPEIFGGWLASLLGQSFVRIAAGSRCANSASLDVDPSAQKKQGATGITTVAPYVAGQWGRGNNRLPG
jgi:hypothetical protein